MPLAWEALGLSRFLAVDAHGTLLFKDGSPCPNLSAEPDGSTILIRFSSGLEDESTIELSRLARALFPTLSDHTLEGLCRHYAIPLREEGERWALGKLLTACIEEALQFDPKLLSLLSQLLPDATGELLRSLIPLAKLAAKPETPERADHEVIPGAVPVGEILNSEGVLGKTIPGFEERLGQQDIAERVSRVLEEGGTLVVEAGPGIGKTFAYLIPVLLYLNANDAARVVISTRTKQLQEQICIKDLPLLVPLLAPNIKVALLKGRENYLCLQRWTDTLREIIEGLEQRLLPSLAPLATWLFQTDTGDIEENNAFLSEESASSLWARLRDDPKYCFGTTCPFLDDCFSLTARRRAREANLIVANHSLILADLQSNRSILGDYPFLIIDEAHALEEAARNALTASLSPKTLDGLLQTGSHHTSSLGRGPSERSPTDFMPSTPRIRELTQSLIGMNARLFDGLSGFLPSDTPGPLPQFDPLKSQIESFLSSFEQLATTVGTSIEGIEDVETKRRAETWLDEIHATFTLYGTMFSPPGENSVHWYGRTENGIMLHASPLEVAPFFETSLYPNLEGLVLTSATLCLHEGFSYLQTALGLDAAPREIVYRQVQAPFSYEERMRLYYASFLPSVNGPVDPYAKALASLIGDVADRTGRKILTLFTSYRLLHAVYDLLRGNGDVLGQGIDGPRSKVLDRFKKSSGGTILLGTDSFWEGVDLPGKDLEILIITRLPFQVPTDPILSALSDKLLKGGRDPFFELTIPRAILKLRQGIGRLIRTEHDRGAVILTDQRILHRHYGRTFAQALPVKGREMANAKDLLRDLISWFSSPGPGPLMD
jgi:ATP-dependent DNA helicase DinG